MTKEQIIESGFIKAFINEYFEYKTHSFYPDKDRLLYILCNSEQEKKEVTIKQFEITKAKVTELGFDELSFAYLLSCKPESLHNYIEPNKGFDFWLKRFSEDFEDHITDFDPITKAIFLFYEVSELSVEVMENESEFWECYPKREHPTIADFISIIPNEAELLSLIKHDIQEYHKNEYWEFDFEEYERFIDVSKPIEILFNLSELLVQLNRLEMFNEFLEIENEALPPQQDERQKPELNEALISFSGIKIIESLHSELKGYFQGKEAELKKALQGEQLKEFLLFPHNQNKFVEVFKRLKYNGFLLSTPKETKDWICSTFTYQYQKGNKKEVREFNTSTVHDILTKDKGEPTKKERICIVDWLPYKSHLTRQREAEKESI